MQPYRKRQQQRNLHVLVVEHDANVLNRYASLLLAEGYDISTARVATGLAERVQRMRPDMVLMNVLMPGLDTRELGKLTSLCRGGSDPVLVVHTKLPRPMLRRVIDLRAVFGLIPEMGDDLTFLRLFQDIADRLSSEMPTQTFVPGELGVLPSSGTYAVTPGPSEHGRELSRSHG
jgi:DNA-binding NarL/FixJ family response regulator